MKNLRKLKGAYLLSKKEQCLIQGGQGPWSIQCESGVSITNAPDCSSASTTFACENQGGWAGTCLCVGSACAEE